MLTRTLGGVIVLVAVGIIVGAGLCLFDNDHDPSIQLDLCGLFFSTNPAPVTFVLGVMIIAAAVLVSPPTVVALDLPTPPPRSDAS
jgi:hypothetical protein